MCICTRYGGAAQKRLCERKSCITLYGASSGKGGPLGAKDKGQSAHRMEGRDVRK